MDGGLWTADRERELGAGETVPKWSVGWEPARHGGVFPVVWISSPRYQQPGLAGGICAQDSECAGVAVGLVCHGL